MDREALKRIQDFVKRQSRQKKDELPSKTIDEMIEDAKKLDEKRARARKTKTKQEIASEELEYMQREFDNAPVEVTEEENKIVYDTIEHDPDKLWDVPLGQKIEYFDPTLSYELTGYRPITMTEGLDFDPKKFTEAADSYRKNGRYTMYAPGTFRNKAFWTEEWNRCVNGYRVGKYRLTGQNYFWLNYYRLQSNISTDGDDMLRIEDFPGFLSKQYEYFHYLELVKLLKKDGLVFKARGVGISEIAASNTVYDYTFKSGSISVITAYIEDYVRTTLSKCWLQLNFLNTQTDGEFRHVRMKLDTDMEKRASKVDKDKNETGWMSLIKGVTHDNPRKLRGLRMNSIYFEEAGSDPVLEQTYLQAEALVRTGGKRMGSRYVQGTGGERGAALAAMNKMFFNPETYKILPYKNTYGESGQVQYTGFFIPAYTMWFGDDEGNKGFDSRGVVYEDKAKAYFIKTFNETKDPQALIITRAEFCFTPEDAFILEGSNRFDQEALIDQYNAITIHKTVEKPRSIKLHWPLDKETGTADRNKRPSVEFVTDSPIKITELPMQDPDGNVYNNLFVAGIDSIDSDSTTSTGQTDTSEFCMVILRRAFGTNPPKVVAIYKERPLHIQNAFDNALKLCSFYNCKVLVEATRISIKQYFEKEHKLDYMMRRPQATANSSKRTNFKQYGVPATEAIIQHQLDLIEQYIVDYSETIQFPEMLQELMKYSYENKRKFDIVAAFGICLLADEDMIGRVAKPTGENHVLTFGYSRNQYGQFGIKYQVENEGVNQYREVGFGPDRAFVSAMLYQQDSSYPQRGSLYP